jgi:hypothetical protein
MAVDRAAGSLAELARLRGAADSGYARELAAHLEAIARVSVIATPLMPHWSAMTGRRLGLPADPVTGMLSWSLLGPRHLMESGHLVACDMPRYFRSRE